MGPKQPVSVAGLEFDAVLTIKETHTSTIPQYPIDEGYSVQDNVALDPMSLSMTLYVTATPVTWFTHGSGEERLRQVWNQLYDLYAQKMPISVITQEASYQNMVIKNIAYQRSADMGYAAEIPVEFSQVNVTSARMAAVPVGYARAGASMQLSGAAATTTATSSGSASGNGSSQTSAGTASSSSTAQQSSSWLYGIAEGVGNSTGWYSLD